MDRIKSIYQLSADLLVKTQPRSLRPQARLTSPATNQLQSNNQATLNPSELFSRLQAVFKGFKSFITTNVTGNNISSSNPTKAITTSTIATDEKLLAYLNVFLEIYELIASIEACSNLNIPKIETIDPNYEKTMSDYMISTQFSLIQSIHVILQRYCALVKEAQLIGSLIDKVLYRALQLLSVISSLHSVDILSFWLLFLSDPLAVDNHILSLKLLSWENFKQLGYIHPIQPEEYRNLFQSSLLQIAFSPVASACTKNQAIKCLCNILSHHTLRRWILLFDSISLEKITKNSSAMAARSQSVPAASRRSNGAERTTIAPPRNQSINSKIYETLCKILSVAVLLLQLENNIHVYQGVLELCEVIIQVTQSTRQTAASNSSTSIRLTSPLIQASQVISATLLLTVKDISSRSCLSSDCKYCIPLFAVKESISPQQFLHTAILQCLATVWKTSYSSPMMSIVWDIQVDGCGQSLLLEFLCLQSMAATEMSVGYQTLLLQLAVTHVELLLRNRALLAVVIDHFRSANIALVMRLLGGLFQGIIRLKGPSNTPLALDSFGMSPETLIALLTDAAHSQDDTVIHLTIIAIGYLPAVYWTDSQSPFYRKVHLPLTTAAMEGSGSLDIFDFLSSHCSDSRGRIRQASYAALGEIISNQGFHHIFPPSPVAAEAGEGPGETPVGEKCDCSLQSSSPLHILEQLVELLIRGSQDTKLGVRIQAMWSLGNLLLLLLPYRQQALDIVNRSTLALTWLSPKSKPPIPLTVAEDCVSNHLTAVEDIKWTEFCHICLNSFEDSDKLLSSSIRCLGFLVAGLSPWDYQHFSYLSDITQCIIHRVFMSSNSESLSTTSIALSSSLQQAIFTITPPKLLHSACQTLGMLGWLIMGQYRQQSVSKGVLQALETLWSIQSDTLRWSKLKTQLQACKALIILCHHGHTTPVTEGILQDSCEEANETARKIIDKHSRVLEAALITMSNCNSQTSLSMSVTVSHRFHQLYFLLLVLLRTILSHVRKLTSKSSYTPPHCSPFPRESLQQLDGSSSPCVAVKVDIEGVISILSYHLKDLILAMKLVINWRCAGNVIFSQSIVPKRHLSLTSPPIIPISPHEMEFDEEWSCMNIVDELIDDIKYIDSNQENILLSYHNRSELLSLQQHMMMIIDNHTHTTSSNGINASHRSTLQDEDEI